MNPLALATAITSLLAPLLPFLVKGGEAVAEEVAKDTWNKAKSIWTRLFGESEDSTRNAALKTAEAVAAIPDNEALKEVWKEELKKLFEADSALADDLTALLKMDQPDQDSGDNIQVQVSGNQNKTIAKVEGQDVSITM